MRQVITILRVMLRLLLWVGSGIGLGLLAGFAGGEAAALTSATAIYCFLLPILTRYELGLHRTAFVTVKLGMLLVISGPIAALIHWGMFGAAVALGAILLVPIVAAVAWGRKGALRHLLPLVGLEQTAVLERLRPARYRCDTEMDDEWLTFGMAGLHTETFALELPGETYVEGAAGFEQGRCVCINYFENRRVTASLKWMTERHRAPLRRWEPPVALPVLRPDLKEWVLEIYTWPPGRKDDGSMRRCFGLLRNFRRFGRIEQTVWSDAQHAARGPGPQLVHTPEFLGTD